MAHKINAEINNKFLDEQRIDANNKNEISYWCKRLHCSKKFLFNSIHSIGNRAKMVDLFLELNRWKNNGLK